MKAQSHSVPAGAHRRITLTLKVPITTAADNIYKYFFIFFSEKIRFDISCESSARQKIHVKHQAFKLFL